MNFLFISAVRLPLSCNLKEWNKRVQLKSVGCPRLSDRFHPNTDIQAHKTQRWSWFELNRTDIGRIFPCFAVSSFLLENLLIWSPIEMLLHKLAWLQYEEVTGNSVLAASDEHMNLFGSGNNPPAHHRVRRCLCFKIRVLDHPKTMYFL